MNSDLKQTAALLLLGISIGCAISHFYFVGFLENRAEDGLPVVVGGHLFQIEYVQPQRLGYLDVPDINVSRNGTEKGMCDNITVKPRTPP